MDPNETLKKIRNLCEKVKGRPKNIDVISDEFVEAFQDLDEWIKKGGFLPEDWQRPVDVVGKKI